MDGRQPRVSTEVRDLVLERLGRGRLLGSRTLQGVDVRPHGGDLGARCPVGLLEVLNAPDQRLVAADLFEGVRSWALTWPATKNPVAICDRRHHQNAEDPAAHHDANSRRVFRQGMGRFLAIAGVVSKFAWRSKYAHPPSRPPSVGSTRRPT